MAQPWPWRGRKFEAGFAGPEPVLRDGCRVSDGNRKTATPRHPCAMRGPRLAAPTPRSAIQTGAPTTHVYPYLPKLPTSLNMYFRDVALLSIHAYTPSFAVKKFWLLWPIHASLQGDPIEKILCLCLVVPAGYARSDLSLLRTEHGAANGR